MMTSFGDVSAIVPPLLDDRDTGPAGSVPFAANACRKRVRPLNHGLEGTIAFIVNAPMESSVNGMTWSWDVRPRQVEPAEVSVGPPAVSMPSSPGATEGLAASLELRGVLNQPSG